MLVETMYNKLAINTGFPLYVNEEQTPETTRFLLEVLNQALLNTIDSIYTSNNVLERRDKIVLTPGMTHYAVEGMVKSIQLTGRIDDELSPFDGRLKGRFVMYNNRVDNPGQILKQEGLGYPVSYVIDRGDIRVFPVPDKPYELEVTVSTEDIVWENDNSSKGYISDVKDAVMASSNFCDLVVLKACAFVMARCQNPLSQFYEGLYTKRLNTFVERDSNSSEKYRLYNPRKGHYNPRKGLIDDYGYDGGRY